MSKIKDIFFNKDIRNGVLIAAYTAFCWGLYECFLHLKGIDVEYNYNKIADCFNTPIKWVKVYHLYTFLSILCVTVLYVTIKAFHKTKNKNLTQLKQLEENSILWNAEYKNFTKTEAFKYFQTIADNIEFKRSFDNITSGVLQLYKSKGIIEGSGYDYQSMKYTNKYNWTNKGGEFARLYLQDQNLKLSPTSLPNQKQSKEQDNEEFYQSFKKTRHFLYFERIIESCENETDISSYPFAIRSYYKSQNIIKQIYPGGLLDWKYQFTEFGKFLHKRFEKERADGTLITSLHTIWLEQYKEFKKSHDRNILTRIFKAIADGTFQDLLIVDPSFKEFEDLGIYEYTNNSKYILSAKGKHWQYNDAKFE